MKRLEIFIILILCVAVIDGPAQEMPRAWYKRSPKPSEVAIWNIGVSVPIGYILLVRKGSNYCAVKFTEAWTGKDRYDTYAKHVSYYLADKKKHFSQENLKLREGELHFRPVNWGGCHFTMGNSVVSCGSYEVIWGHPTFLGFREPGQEYQLGIEIAPTRWTDISEVNVSDPRLKWYQYDEYRPPLYIPIDELWTDTKEGEKEFDKGQGDTGK